jgi:hypothetical protein
MRAFFSLEKSMKIFWWQGGLHFEPENTVDRDALMLLWRAERVSPIKGNQTSCSTVSGSSVISEHVENSLVTS